MGACLAQFREDLKGVRCEMTEAKTIAAKAGERASAAGFEGEHRQGIRRDQRQFNPGKGRHHTLESKKKAYMHSLISVMQAQLASRRLTQCGIFLLITKESLHANFGEHLCQARSEVVRDR